MATATRHRQSSPRWSLWFAVFGGATAWVIQLLLGYYFASQGCQGLAPGFQVAGVSGFFALIALLSLLCALVAAAAAVTAWSLWHAASEGQSNGEAGRIRFMAQTGFAASILFLLLILVTAVPDFVLHHCAV
jgi:cytochrome bd-type quinol oxidase subunit 2